MQAIGNYAGFGAILPETAHSVAVKNASKVLENWVSVMNSTADALKYVKPDMELPARTFKIRHQTLLQLMRNLRYKYTKVPWYQAAAGPLFNYFVPRLDKVTLAEAQDVKAQLRLYEAAAVNLCKQVQMISTKAIGGVCAQEKLYEEAGGGAGEGLWGKGAKGLPWNKLFLGVGLFVGGAVVLNAVTARLLSGR